MTVVILGIIANLCGILILYLILYLKSLRQDGYIEQVAYSARTAETSAQKANDRYSKLLRYLNLKEIEGIVEIKKEVV